MLRPTQREAKLIAVAGFFIVIVLMSCSRRTEQPGAGATAGPPPSKSSRTLDEAALAGMNSHEVANYVFRNYDCNNCHTLSDGGKFGFTGRGQQIRNNSEGCVSLLTSMSVIAHIEEPNRTPEQKEKAAHFNEYGCTMCHQVSPGRLGLTETGGKLTSLHMSCSEVQRILNQRQSAKSD